MRQTYDLIVIGAGTAAQTAISRARKAIFGLVKGFRLPREDRFDGRPPLPAEKPLKRPRGVPEPAE